MDNKLVIMQSSYGFKALENAKLEDVWYSSDTKELHAYFTAGKVALTLCSSKNKAKAVATDVLFEAYAVDEKGPYEWNDYIGIGPIVGKDDMFGTVDWETVQIPQHIIDTLKEKVATYVG